MVNYIISYTLCWTVYAMYGCCDSDPKCYNPRVLKSLCHEKRRRSDTAKQFFRSSAATHFSSRVSTQHVDSVSHAAAEHDMQQQSDGDMACNGDHDNRQQQQQQHEWCHSLSLVGVINLQITPLLVECIYCWYADISI